MPGFGGVPGGGMFTTTELGGVVTGGPDGGVPVDVAVFVNEGESPACSTCEHRKKAWPPADSVLPDNVPLIANGPETVPESQCGSLRVSPSEVPPVLVTIIL